MKKRISLIVALVLILTNLLSISVFADFSDVSVESQYRKGILTLTQLGVINGYDDGTFKPEGEITRAEFTKMIMTALGRGNTGAVPTEFNDVADHWAKSYIKSAYDIGIINGFPDGTFAPDAQVTYEQALKMVVCALGYVDFAEDRGGYPSGYVTQASSLNLTDGVSGQKQTEPALRQVIAQVVYNALEVEKRELNRKGEWQETGKTILADDLNMAKITGIITGVEEVTTEACQNTLLKYQMAVNTKDGEIVIDTREYADMTTAALQNYVGIEATLYYDKDSDEKYLRIFDAETIQNETQTISSYDITSYNGSTLRYFEGDNGREKSKTVRASDITVVYNGETLNEDDSYPVVSKQDGTTIIANGKTEVLDYLLNEGEYKIYGDITFTDSGADGTVDMATINDYRWMIAHKAVSSANYTVQNALVTTDTLVIDPDEPDYKIYVEKNGKEVAPTAISKGDVLTYTKSFDGTIIKVYADKETVEGRVTSMRDNEITIGTTVYNLDPRCVEFVQAKTNKALEAGNTVKAYIDKMGTVVYAEISTEAAAPYAYIANMQYETAEDALYVVAYIPSVSKNSVSSYQVADRVRVNGRICNSAEEARVELAKSAGYNLQGTEAEVSSQVARIKLDSDRMISEIITLAGDTVGSNSNATTIVKGAEYAKYNYASSKFKIGDATKFSVNSSTVFIDVPPTRTDKNKYVTRTSGYYTNAGECMAEAFDINENNYAGLVVRYVSETFSTLNAPNYDTAFSIIGGDARTEYDEDENTTVASIPMYINSISTTTKQVLSTDTNKFMSLDKGDIIQYSYDSDGKISDLKYVIKYEDIKGVLEEGVYDWTQRTDEQVKDNRWQRYTFDFKYPKKGLEDSVDTEDYYEVYSTSDGEPRSRATMYNVLGIEDGKIRVTTEGFKDNVLEPNDYEYVTISDKTPIIKAVTDTNGNITKFTEFEEDGATKLSIDSFVPAKDGNIYNPDCSKIMVATNKGNAKMIVIYE